MAKITGLGGVFYVVKDPAATRAWYRDTLGLDGEYGPQLDWSEEPAAKPYSLISHFKDSEYIEPGVGGFHFRMGDARDLAAQLERFITDPGLLDALAAQQPQLPSRADHVEAVAAIYAELLAEGAKGRDR